MLRVLDSYMLTGCKSLYDALVRIESSGLWLTEKRTAVEVLCIRQRTENLRFNHRWIPGDQNLSDGLTKISPCALDALMRALRLGRWGIVFDETFTSAKKKSAAKRKGVG